MPAFERVGVTDYKYSEKGCAASCLRQGGDAEIQESIDCCRGQIAHYKVLRCVRFVPEFPMTVTGKMLKIPHSAAAGGADGIRLRAGRVSPGRSSMALRKEVAILGAGPAAIATACALRRLGHDVLLIGVPRNSAVEGVSQRTLRLLREHGLAAAADSVGDPGERVGSWAGIDVAGNGEYVVQRAEFDRALLADAAAIGVRICAERVVRYERRGALWRVHTKRNYVDCQVAVDARGRRAQRSPRRGPALIAVCQRLCTPRTGRVLTRLEAIPQGWCWLAADGRGMSWLQITSGREPSLRLGLEEHMRRLVAMAPHVAADLSGAIATGAPIARAATPSLCTQPDQVGVIRAGDASIALDPLSGQGMYEALRSVVAVTGAVRGYLSGSWDPIAKFMAERAAELWQQSSLKAAHHYGQQAQQNPSSFWSEAAARYCAIQPTPPSAGGVSIDWRPVLNGARIELRRVVVTPQSPRGVWQVDAIDLPELLDFLRAARVTNVERAARHFGCPPAATARAMQWLSEHGLLEPAGAAGSTGPHGPPIGRFD